METHAAQLALLQRANFFQAIRLMLAEPEGRAWPIESRVRFSAELSPAFPGTEISAIETEAAGSDGAFPVSSTTSPATRFHVKTPNYCVAGGLGPLPPVFTEWLQEQARGGRSPAPRFFDVFNNRLNLLRYRLKESCTPALNNLPPETSALGSQLAALCGLAPIYEDSRHGPRQSPLPRRLLLSLGGILTDCRKSASQAVAVLQAVLKVPVRLTPYVGAWRTVEAQDRLSLGRSNHALGRGAPLGSQVWDQQARVRLSLGPLHYKMFRALLPPQQDGSPAPRHAAFVALVGVLLNHQVDVEVCLEVDPSTIGQAVLTRNPQAPKDDGARNDAGLRLGESAWLGRAEGSIKQASFLIPAFASKAQL